VTKDKVKYDVDTLWQIKQIDRPELDFWAGGSKKVLKRKKNDIKLYFPAVSNLDLMMESPPFYHCVTVTLNLRYLFMSDFRDVMSLGMRFQALWNLC
jgi:hypothetical protein